MVNLKELQQELDETVKRRLTIISIEADKKLTLIIEDAKREQDSLLAYDRNIQTRQEELYQEWLQKYIVELNKWRSGCGCGMSFFHPSYPHPHPRSPIVIQTIFTCKKFF